MKHFKRVTVGTEEQNNAVVMGRKTWESIPPKFRPLAHRTNLVLTRQDPSKLNLPPGVLAASSLQEAYDKLKCQSVDEIYLIGGAELYQQALKDGVVNKVVYTEVSNVPEDQHFDAYFPELSEAAWLRGEYGASSQNDKENTKLELQKYPVCGTDPTSGLSYHFYEYTRRNMEELQYLNLCREIMETGLKKGDRTGTGTLSKFGTQLRFSLQNGRLPLLTTKRTFWRGVVEELLWFISVSHV